MRIDHIAIWCDNLESMREFYTTYFACHSNDIYRNPKKGYEEVFRTTKSGYIPAGWELVTKLYNFTIGDSLPYGQPEKPKKKSLWEKLLS